MRGFNSAKIRYRDSPTVSSAAFRRSFDFVARVPAGVENVAVAVDRVKELSEISDIMQRANIVIYKFHLCVVKINPLLE